MLPIISRDLIALKKINAIAYHLKGRSASVQLHEGLKYSSDIVDRWFVYSDYKWSPEASPFSSFFEETEALHSVFMIYDPRITELIEIENRNDKKYKEINSLHSDLLGIAKQNTSVIFNCKKEIIENEDTPYLFSKNDSKYKEIMMHYGINEKKPILFPGVYDYKKRSERNDKYFIFIIDEIIEITKLYVDRNQECKKTSTTDGKHWHTTSEVIVTDKDKEFAIIAQKTVEEIYRSING